MGVDTVGRSRANRRFAAAGRSHRSIQRDRGGGSEFPVTSPTRGGIASSAMMMMGANRNVNANTRSGAPARCSEGAEPRRGSGRRADRRAAYVARRTRSERGDRRGHGQCPYRNVRERLAPTHELAHLTAEPLTSRSNNSSDGRPSTHFHAREASKSSPQPIMTVVGDLNSYGGTYRFFGAGPWRMRAAESY